MNKLVEIMQAGDCEEAEREKSYCSSFEALLTVGSAVADDQISQTTLEVLDNLLCCPSLGDVALDLDHAR